MSFAQHMTSSAARCLLLAGLCSCGDAQHAHAFMAADPGLASTIRGASALSLVAATSAPLAPAAFVADSASECPAGMAHIKRYCIDRYEAYVVELDQNGLEFAHSPYVPVDGLRVRAKVAAGVVPQGYISQVQAAQACQNAGKRLCSAAEFSLACRGPNERASYPYGGTHRQAGKCNEGKGSAVPEVFGRSAPFSLLLMNDPRLNRWAGGLAKTGAYSKSASPYGVFDLVGNLHEWGSEVALNGHGYFRGGFYGDAEINGPGCAYVTKAHAVGYHDYSTGFRCCRDTDER